MFHILVLRLWYKNIENLDHDHSDCETICGQSATVHIRRLIPLVYSQTCTNATFNLIMHRGTDTTNKDKLQMNYSKN